MYCTNTVAGKICLLLQHPCKYSYDGCPEKMKLPDIEEHERRCEKRTVLCAFRGDQKHECFS